MKAFLFVSLSLAASASMAHHGSNGQFDHDRPVVLTGLVSDFRLVNPHSYVYFDVVGETGETEEWRCEMRAASRLRTGGWTEEMLAPGTSITINGSQARREEFGCYADIITFSNGLAVGRAEAIATPESQPVEEVELAAGTPVINGRWRAVDPRAPGGYVPALEALATEAAAWPTDVPVPQGRVSFIASDLGKAAVGPDFNREMNPRFHCEATNIFADWHFNSAVNKIEQSDDKIVITYGFMDIVRTIHLDMDSHPENITPSVAGHSIGKWEGDTLMIDTIGFAEGWLELGRAGIKNSEQMHTVETFNLSSDDEWLVMTYTVNDPLYLTQPYTGQITQGRSTEPSVPYDCDDLTEEVVDGF